MQIAELKKLIISLRIDILEMTHKAQSGHVGGSLSAIDILATLYFGEIKGERVMNYDPKKPGWDKQDYFILSKGHASPALYSVLAAAGFFPREEFDHLRQVGALLQGHPVIKIPGVTMTTGSLGQGLSAANGMALALKIDKKKNYVYCVLGDGELQEGQVWEAAMTTAHYKLSNVCVFVDNNQLQIDGPVKGIMNVDPIQDKFEAFGWRVIPLLDGNDPQQILEGIAKAWKEKKKPTMILAPTIKGKGVPFAEGKVCYHGTAFSKEEMGEARKCLDCK